MTGVSLQDGWLPTLLLVLGVVGAAFLLARRERWWWIWFVPVALVVSAAVAWALGTLFSEAVIGQKLENTSDYVWLGVIVAAIIIGIGRCVKVTWWQPLVTLLAAVLVIAAAANQINRTYVQYPTLGDVLGAQSEYLIDGPPPVPTTVGELPAGPLESVWTPEGNISANGRVSPMTIPGTVSGFKAREAQVYYPPAYEATNPQRLPVLVLLAGQPGSPGDWFLGDRLQQVMDPMAAKNKGIAPIVVVPDILGDATANPGCFNSSLGNVDTYLSVDVPAAINKQLLAQTDHQHWAIGGFSAGATCSLQMATNHPDIYPTFLAFAGELNPSTGGSMQDTINTAFGGDAAKYKAVNPLDLMASKQYPNVAGWFVAGSEDPIFGPVQPQLLAAAQKAGMNVQLYTNPGTGHAWDTVTGGLAHVLPWLYGRLGITAAS